MNHKEAILKMAELISHRSMPEWEVKPIWEAFMARTSIGMQEPDKKDWTDRQHSLWDILWKSDLNPF